MAMLLPPTMRLAITARRACVVTLPITTSARLKVYVSITKLAIQETHAPIRHGPLQTVYLFACVR